MVTTTSSPADEPLVTHDNDNVVEDNDYAALSNLIDEPHPASASHHGSILEQTQDQDETEQPVGEVTQSALNLLFNGLGDEVGPGLAEDAEGLDSTLASQERHHAALHHGQDGELAQHETGSSAEQDDGLSSTAPVKRKATSRANMLTRGGACEFCKRRKLRCTAELPSCAACIRASQPCIYSQKKQRSRVKMLEDRLVELEKRLEGGPAPSKAGPAPAGPTYPTPPQLAIEEDSQAAFPFIAIPPEGPEPFAFPTPEASYNLSSHDVDPSLSAGLLLEPDLMTLADAAAADPAIDTTSDLTRKHPWENMTPDAIGHAIVSAVVEGEKGIGAKIVAHFLRLYSTLAPHHIAPIVVACPPKTLLQRLKATSTDPPHPALLLAVITNLLQYSPSPVISSGDNPDIIAAILSHSSRIQTTMASAQADGRLLDQVASRVVRSWSMYRRARFLDGWFDTAGTASWVAATGLTKLAGLGQRLVGGDAKWSKQVAATRKLRSVRHMATVVEYPKDVEDLAARIKLFWAAYQGDRLASVGWAWPSGFIDDEITTPWPHDDYSSADTCRDDRSIADFFDLSNSSPTCSGVTGRSDSDWCCVLKTLTLYERAAKQFDLAPGLATPDRNMQIRMAITRYRDSMRRVPALKTREDALRYNKLNLAWTSVHGALCLSWLKEEVDAWPSPRPDLPEKIIEGATRVLTHIKLAQAAGDPTLEFYDTHASVIWGDVARTLGKYARDLAERPDENSQQQSTRVRQLCDELIQILYSMEKNGRCNRIFGQSIENLSNGFLAKQGEYCRADYFDSSAS